MLLSSLMNPNDSANARVLAQLYLQKVLFLLSMTCLTLLSALPVSF